MVVDPSEEGTNSEQGPHPAQRELVQRTIAYVHALRHHLRGSSPFVDLSEYLDESELELLRCHPFGTDPHDLPLGAISQTIEINLTQLLGGRDVCELPTPTNGILL